MPRLTISIPDELQRKLSSIRVRQALNVSRVCQAALRREVQRLLDLPLDLQRMEVLLGRLREDRQSREDRWFEAGSAAARDWIEHEASEPELRALGELTIDQRIAELRRRPPLRLAEAIQHGEREEDFRLESLLSGWAATLGLMWWTIQRNL